MKQTSPDNLRLLSRANDIRQTAKSIKAMKDPARIATSMNSLLKNPAPPPPVNTKDKKWKCKDRKYKKCHKGCEEKKCKKDKVTYINCLPYVIKEEGKYIVTKDLSFDATKVPGQTIAILIEANEEFDGGVYLDFNGHSLDMLYKAGTAILLSGVTDITIVNGTIRNSGNPQPISPNQYAIPPVSLIGAPFPDSTDSTLGGQQLILNNFLVNNPEFPNPILPSGYVQQSAFTVVTALNKFDGTGICIIQACVGVIIKNMTFSSMFIGISCLSYDTNDGSDGSDDIFILNCYGIECGGDFTGSEPPVDPFSTANFGLYTPYLYQPNRGAFINFSALTFIGPYQSSPFYNIPEAFERITVQNCIALSDIALAGIFLNYTSGSLIENCFMACTADDLIPNTWDAVAPYQAYFNSHLNIRNSVAVGGLNGFDLQSCYSCVLDNCLAIYHYSTAYEINYGQNITLRDCIASESTNTKGFIGINYGIVFIACAYSTVVSCMISNYRGVNCNISDLIGLNVNNGDHCLFKDNIIFQNNIGFQLFDSANCIVDGNEIFSNGRDLSSGNYLLNYGSQGLTYAVSATLLYLPINGDPLRGNQFYRNYLHNNGHNGATNVVSYPNQYSGLTGLIQPLIPYLVSAPFNGLDALASYANIQSQPSVWILPLPPVLLTGGFPLNQYYVTWGTDQQGDTPFMIGTAVQAGSSSATITYTLYQANGIVQPSPTDPVNTTGLFTVIPINGTTIACEDDGWYFVEATFTVGGTTSSYYSNYMYVAVLGTVNSITGSVSNNNGTVTYTTADATNYKVGDIVVINGVYSSEELWFSGYNIPNAKILSVSGNTFTVDNDAVETYSIAPVGTASQPSVYQQCGRKLCSSPSTFYVINVMDYPPRALITIISDAYFGGSSGYPGDPVYIAGNNFVNASAIYFDDEPAQFISSFIGTIEDHVVTVPEGVVLEIGFVLSGDNITPGTTVSGAGFTTNQYLVNLPSHVSNVTISVPFVSFGESVLGAYAPEQPAGVVDIRVKTVAGWSYIVPADKYTYLSDSQLTKKKPMFKDLKQFTSKKPMFKK